MHKNLIIWDFDGVIADSEYLWVRNWVEALKEQKNIILSPEQQTYYLAGKADKTKVELLTKDYPFLQFDEPFWQQLRQNEDKLITTELKMTANVENILNDTAYAHCVATGANEDKHFKKVHHLKLEKYFTPENSFNAYQVKYGKPAPHLFLYAAEKMGYAPADCLVIEDSLVGIAAAKAAAIPVIAYIGATGNNSEEHEKKCRELGADYICRTMEEVHQTIHRHFT